MTEQNIPPDDVRDILSEIASGGITGYKFGGRIADAILSDPRIQVRLNEEISDEQVDRALASWWIKGENSRESMRAALEAARKARS